MKSVMLFALSILWSSLLGYDVKIRVVDDEGRRVSDATATIAFVGFVQGSGKTFEGKTDEAGEFRAVGRAEHSVFLVANKTGHYEARIDRLPNNKNLEIIAVTPRMLNPIPLYANRFSQGSERGLNIPVQNVWLGFDFEVGDWIRPHGKGKVADIQFKFRNSFRGYEDSIKNLDEEIAFSKRAYAARKEEWTEEKFRLRGGKWDAELEISFPAEKEGIFEETRFLSYSQLKLPHSAPVDGYVPTWRYTANSYSPRTARENVGFFLRTRVKLDQNGKIISGNYAKVVGDFYLVPQGSLMFCYYFNPVPNDRNLEFDPKRNLFPPNFPGANVGDP